LLSRCETKLSGHFVPGNIRKPRLKRVFKLGGAHALNGEFASIDGCRDVPFFAVLRTVAA